MSVNPDRPAEITPEELAAQTALYAPFTQAVRELVDATIRTTVDPATIRTAQAEVEAITARLREEQLEGSLGAHFGHGRARQPWGNTVVGLRNPVAPPLRPVPAGDREGEVHAEVVLGAAYEGPPGLVHGGVSSLLLDQILGTAAAAAGKPGMTAYLNLTYRRPTPLGPLRVEGWVDRSEGHKTWARGHVVGPDGPTVEAEGLFVLPRWARELLARRGDAEAPPAFE
ncbi:PaaI family thioesterase [Nocardioides sp. SOB77]|uniref:Acyl-coenzyme A thioesterase THEM4 n=1 Tax=Nocardioides oceani TaxID=3058369 RepID=A0ABT8FIH0_9ACTN|nr:PaaI family thioesterase [Nocardioides oceani]MDN4174463.1 PaaI family thioesterase [Nocardioides oceani]